MSESLNAADQEILVKLADPRYFIERCLSIVDQSLQRVPYIFNPVQDEFYQERSGLDMIVKSRKQGFSALITAICLHSCLFVPHTRAVIISHEEGATIRLFERVKDYIKHCQLPIRTKKDSETALSFPDTESWFYVGTAGAKSFGRGDDITIAHFSEAAHYQDYSVITSVLEAFVKSGKTWAVQESTAKGAGTSFHQSWLRAISKESAWRPHFFGWWQDPLNTIAQAGPVELTDEEKRLKSEFSLDWGQLAWRRHKIASMDDPSLFPQEYPATWEQSALPVKWRGHIMDRGGSITVEPDPKGPFYVWRTPVNGARYLLVADVADGVLGGAYSVFDIYDMRTWEQLAQWRGHVDPVEFAHIMMRAGAFYGWALIAVENNYPGNASLSHISEAGYPNIWDEPGEAGDAPGWKTTMQSKAEFIADGRAALKDGSLKIHSPNTLNEMRTFVLENNKMQPQAGCFQDTVIVACKAANILKRMHLEPEVTRPKFHDVMGFKRRTGGNAGGQYNTKVV